MRDLPLDELLRRCSAHDSEAWMELVNRHRALVWSVPLRLGLAPQDAAEVFQDVFESLLRNLPNLKNTDRLSSWLYTAARRLSLRRIAMRRRAASREDLDERTLDDVQSPDPSIADRLVDAERSGEVLRLLASLPDRCRSLLEALFLDPDEPDYDQISQRLGIPRGSIGPTRIRCLAKLHEILRRENYPFGER